ncbi:MAG: hypothetical protein EA397_13005 [Deltaproteobacteria bacterium]|nr:MAG: hypothetical protein EA397_13005 [Deltaproteobacteria bacterium]
MEGQELEGGDTREITDSSTEQGLEGDCSLLSLAGRWSTQHLSASFAGKVAKSRSGMALTPVSLCRS